MYRSELNTRDKSGAIAAVVSIHACLLLILLNLSGTLNMADPQRALTVFNVEELPPPPPPVREQHLAKPREKEGGSAPKNIKSEATPVVAPKPRIELPPVQKMAAAEIRRLGTDPTQGASNVRGPGTGAGGNGTGTGNGAGGNGPGGGGDGGIMDGPHLVTSVLTGRDIPRDVLRQWPPGATVFMRLRVDPRGYVSECMVDRGTGFQAVDSMLCNLAHERLRFRPAINRNGQAVAGWFGYAQPAPR